MADPVLPIMSPFLNPTNGQILLLSRQARFYPEGVEPTQGLHLHSLLDWSLDSRHIEHTGSVKDYLSKLTRRIHGLRAIYKALSGARLVFREAVDNQGRELVHLTQWLQHHQVLIRRAEHERATLFGILFDIPNKYHPLLQHREFQRWELLRFEVVVKQ